VALDAVGARLRGTAGRVAPPAVALLFAVLLCVDLIGMQGHVLRQYTAAVGNVNDMQVTLGEWVLRHVPETDSVAVSDIGAIAFFGHRGIIDTVGLVTPDIRPYRLRSLRQTGALDSGILEYIERRRPSYLIIFPWWLPRLSRTRPLLEEVTSVRLENNVVCGGRTMTVYRLRWDLDPNPVLPAPAPSYADGPASDEWRFQP
jgi:hypothetical protein